MALYEFIVVRHLGEQKLFLMVSCHYELLIIDKL